MPNRIIKESLCTSPNLNKISSNAECLFFRLIVNCDDYGRTEYNPKIIRSKCFPLKIDDIPDNDIVAWVTELSEAKLAYLYSVDGRQFIQLTTWDKHQQIRAKRSKYPEPNGNDSTCYQLIADDSICPRNPIQSNPIRIQSESNTSNFVLPDFLNEDTWNDFMEMRQKKKAPNTVRAKKLLIKRLEEFKCNGEDANKIIEESILRGWTGVFSHGTHRQDNTGHGNTGADNRKDSTKYTSGKYGKLVK